MKARVDEAGEKRIQHPQTDPITTLGTLKGHRLGCLQQRKRTDMQTWGERAVALDNRSHLNVNSTSPITPPLCSLGLASQATQDLAYYKSHVSPFVLATRKL